MTKPLYIIRMYSCFTHLLLIFHKLLMNVYAFANYAIEFVAESLQAHYNHLQSCVISIFFTVFRRVTWLRISLWVT
jgi:hypothetical protein